MPLSTRTWAAAGTAAAALVAVTFTLERRPDDPPRRVADLPFDADPQPVARGAAGVAYPEPESRLPTETDLRHERDEQAVDGLIDLLVGVSETPDAERLASRMGREFHNEPRLRQAIEAYKQLPRETRPPLRATLRTLADLPEFRRLAARFAAAASSSARMPVAGGESPRVLAGGATPGPGTPLPGPGTPFPGPGNAALAVPVAVARTGGGAARPSAAAQALAARASGLGLRAADTRGAQGRYGSSRTESSAVEEAGPAKSAASRPPSAGAGAPGAHEVDAELKAVTAVGKDDWQSPTKYITELLLLLPKADRLVIEDKLGAEDLWGACFITARYGLCRQTCDQLKESRCTDVPQVFDACWRAGTRGKVDCVRLCTDRGDLGCAVPRAERDAVCAPGPGSISCNYCATDENWGPYVPGDPEGYQPKGCGISGSPVDGLGPPATSGSGSGGGAKGPPMTCLAAADTTCCFGRSGALVSSTNSGYLTKGGPNYSVGQCSGANLRPAGSCRALNAQGDIECTDSSGRLISRGGDPSR